jgi:hypothetical protein
MADFAWNIAGAEDGRDFQEDGEAGCQAEAEPVLVRTIRSRMNINYLATYCPTPGECPRLLAASFSERSIRIHPARESEEVDSSTLEGPAAVVNCLAAYTLPGGGSRVAAGFRDGTLLLADGRHLLLPDGTVMPQQALVRLEEHHRGGVKRLLSYEDPRGGGRRLATAGPDGIVKVRTPNPKLSDATP